MKNIITQYGVTGISVILDKSAFHSFSDSDMHQLCRYYRHNITPILVMEVLGDLKKETPDGTLNAKTVTNFANKLSAFNTTINSHYSVIIAAEMSGMQVPTRSPVVDTGERIEMEDGKTGILINPSHERNSIDRWKDGNFEKMDEVYSKLWRDLTIPPEYINSLKETLRKSNPELNLLKNPEDIIYIIKLAFDNPDLHRDILRSAIETFKIPFPGQVFYRWEISNLNNLFAFAPYTFYCLITKIFFNICLQNNVIGPRATNLLDMEYMYYLPFCKVFVSDDKLHKKLVPYLLNPDQLFVTGQELKGDFKKIEEVKLTLSATDLKRIHREPPRVKDLLSYKIWNKMLVEWPPEKDWEPSPEEYEMMLKAARDISNSIKGK